MDTVRLRELIDQLDDLKREIADTITGVTTPAPKRTVKCGKCGEEGHTTRTCPKPEPVALKSVPTPPPEPPALPPPPSPPAVSPLFTPKPAGG